MTTPAALLAASESGDVLLELGAVLVVLAVVGRLAARLGLPSIPLYLIAGLLLGEGSAFPLEASTEFIRISADVGVVLLLLLLGLEYTPTELRSGLTSGWAAGLADLIANSAPGLLAGLVLGWGPVAALVLAGVTYISSSGIIAKQLFDLDRIANRETSTVLTILVLEDLVMAAYLPLIGVLLVGSAAAEAAISIVVAVSAVGATLLIASRHSRHINRVLDTGSSELLLLSVLGLALLIGGLAERVQVSAAVAAFLVGVTLSDRVAERGREVLLPIRDVFGGLFFVFFGLQVDPGALPPVLVPALLLAIAGAATKTATGWWAAKRAGIGPRGRLRAGLSLVPRGEFSPDSP
jgi:CPA2 family monovalent cation:H+ antiporter-2